MDILKQSQPTDPWNEFPDADPWVEFPDADPWAEFPDAEVEAENPMGIRRQTGAALAGFNRGLANVLGAPVDLVNAGLEFAGVPVSEKPFMGSEYIKEMGETPVPENVPVVGGGQLIREPDPEYPTTDRIGEMTGTGVGTIATMGVIGSTAPATKVGQFAKSLSDPTMRSGKAFVAQVPAEVAASSGAIAGGSLGEGVGEQIGGERGRQIGKTVGSIAGGLTPATAGIALEKTLRAPVRRPSNSSPETLRVLDSNGIEPSPGLVGNKTAARLENASAYLPLGGSAVRTKQERQLVQFGDALQRHTAERRGFPSNKANIEKGSIGRQLQDASKEGLEKVKASISRRESDLAKKIEGSKTAIDPKRTIEQIKQLHGQSTPQQQAVLEKAISDLDSMRTLPIDAQLQKSLMQRKAILEKNLSGSGSVAKANEYQNALTEIENQLSANLGIDYGRFREWRNEIGRNTEQAGIQAGKMKQVYSSATGSLEKVANKAGAREEFRALMRDEKQLYSRTGNLSEGGDIAILREQVLKRDGVAVFNYLVEGGKQAPERLEAVARNLAPKRWEQISADILEAMGRTKPGDVATSAEFSPQAFLQNWETMSERTRTLLAGDGKKALDDLALAARSLKERNFGGRYNPSLPATVTGAALGAAVVTHPIATALGIGTGAAVAKGLSSESFARYLASEAPSLAERFGPRLTTTPFKIDG